MHPCLQCPRLQQIHQIVDPHLHIFMGCQRLKPFISAHIQKAAASVHDHFHGNAAVGCAKKRRHHIFSGFIRIKVKCGHNNFVLRFLDHTQTAKQCIGIIIDICHPLRSCLLLIKRPCLKMLLKGFRYFFMRNIRNDKRRDIKKQDHKQYSFYRQLPHRRENRFPVHNVSSLNNCSILPLTLRVLPGSAPPELIPTTSSSSCTTAGK